MTAILTLGRDAEVKEDPSWKSSLITFSGASSERWKDKDGVKQEKTTWVKCDWWAKSTLIAKFLTKGCKVYVEGTPDVSVWQNKDESLGSNLVCKVFKVDIVAFAKSEEEKPINAIPIQGDDLPY